MLPGTCSSPWGGIAIDSTGTAQAAPTQVIQHVRLEGALGAAGSGALSVTGSKASVEGCSIKGLGPAVTAASSLITAIDSSFHAPSGDSEVVRVSGAGQSRSAIERCGIEAGLGNGISLSLASIDLRENTIGGADGAGIAITGDGPLGGVLLQQNIVHDCGVGVSVSNGAHVTGDHDTVSGNDVGLLLQRRGASSDGGHVTLHSVIVWSNTEGVSVDSASSAAFTFSDIGSGPWPGAGNITDDPRFLDFLAPDYRLRAASPCIGSGMDGTDMGALPFDSSAVPFIRMDADGSGTVNVTDAIRVLDFLFRSGAPPACMDAADGNDDGEVDISDPVSLLLYLFVGGITPPPPFPDPGQDPTSDGLGC